MYTIEIQSFPCIDYFKKAIRMSHLKIERYDSFQKTSFRNRYVIAGANGLSFLTIPMAGGREQKTLIKEVKIDYSVNWPEKHFRSIRSSYSNSPFYQYYENEVKNLLFSNEKYLFDFNIKILVWLFKVLKTKVVIEFTTSFLPLLNEGVDLRGILSPKNYQDSDNNWKPVYPQVFEDRFGFQKNLSILDLLFCTGPNSLSLLEGSVK